MLNDEHTINPVAVSYIHSKCFSFWLLKEKPQASIGVEPTLIMSGAALSIVDCIKQVCAKIQAAHHLLISTSQPNSQS